MITERRKSIVDELEAETEELQDKVKLMPNGEVKVYMEIDKDLLDNALIIIKDVFSRRG